MIYLDFDGVLVLSKDGRDSYGPLFAPEFVNNLDKLIEITQEHRIVVISDWRSSGLIILREMWGFRKMPGEIVGSIEYDPRGNWRAKQIEIYRATCPKSEPFVILDDMKFFYTDTALLENLVHCPKGLTEDVIQKAIKILRP